jgi:hypothetical protein
MQFLLGKLFWNDNMCSDRTANTVNPLAHNYDIQLPGYASDVIRIEQNKADLKAIASTVPATRASRLAAVQQAKSGAKVKG